MENYQGKDLWKCIELWNSIKEDFIIWKRQPIAVSASIFKIMISCSMCTSESIFSLPVVHTPFTEEFNKLQGSR